VWRRRCIGGVADGSRRIRFRGSRGPAARSDPVISLRPDTPTADIAGFRTASDLVRAIGRMTAHAFLCSQRRFHSKRRAVCVRRDHYQTMLTLSCRCFIKRFDRSTYPRLVGTARVWSPRQADSQDFELTRNRNSGRTAGRRSVNFVGSTKTSRRLRLPLSSPGDSGRLDGRGVSWRELLGLVPFFVNPTKSHVLAMLSCFSIQLRRQGDQKALRLHVVSGGTRR